MNSRELHPRAWVSILLLGLYTAAEALCSIFVSVFFWITSLDFAIICHYYIVLYATTPLFFIIAGWLSQKWDRVLVYRIGVALHAVYYGLLLSLGESAADYAILLGFILGITWGFFWAGQNTFNFDVTLTGSREFYIGLMSATVGFFRLVSPMIGALLIMIAPDKLLGYQFVFGTALVIYLVCVILSFWMPRDPTPRPFHIKRALFPPKEHRDWRLILGASLATAGAYNIFIFILALAMFMVTTSELSVGAFASFQALAGITTAAILSRMVTPANRKTVLLLGTIILVAGGIMVGFVFNIYTLIVFGFLRSVAGPFFKISHTGLRYDIIAKTIDDPGQRIEYLCAWEVPLAIGRVIMMITFLILYEYLGVGELGIRYGIVILCMLRIVTYILLASTDEMRRPTEAPAATPEQV